MTGVTLSNAEWDALERSAHPVSTARAAETVEAIVAARLAAERERIARAIEKEMGGGGRTAARIARGSA